jgi:hypothetical protein
MFTITTSDTPANCDLRLRVLMVRSGVWSGVVFVYTRLKIIYRNKRLLSKLKPYGLSDIIILWIKAFLCNRQQRVRVKGTFSKWHKVIKVFSGIPQLLGLCEGIR